MRLSWLTRLRPSRHGEEGSLPVVLSVVFIVVLVSTALTSRVTGDQDNVNLETKMAQARALAQSGLSDALFQIDQQASYLTSFCNEPNSGGACTLSGIPGAPGAVYTARFDSTTATYTVLSQGTSKGQTYAIKATIKKAAIVQDAVYGGSFITFDGKSTSSLTVTDKYGNPVAGATGGIGVGPGGTMTCNGPSDPNAMYTNYGGSISKCTPIQNLGPVYDPQQPSQTCPAPANPYGEPPTPCMPSTVSACLTMGTNVSGSDTNGYTVAGPATLEPGVYVCRGGLTMTGTVNIDYGQNPLQNGGRVEIYVFPPVGSSTSPNVDLSAATVNQCQTIGTGSTGVCKGGIVGDPADLVIDAWGSGTANLAGGFADAVLWGPGMSLNLNGTAAALNWTGALMVGGVTADGHPTFNVNFDQRLLTEFDQSSWQITNYIRTTPNFAIP